VITANTPSRRGLLSLKEIWNLGKDRNLGKKLYTLLRGKIGKMDLWVLSEHQCAMCADHIYMDGWIINVLLRTLSKLFDIY